MTTADENNNAANHVVSVHSHTRGCFSGFQNKMKMLVFILAACCVPAFAQVEHGTIDVIYFSDEKIAVATDSREIISGVTDSPNDHACKVAALHGEAIFVMSGADAYRGNGA